MIDSYILGVWFDHHQTNSNQPPQEALKHYKVISAVISFIGQTYSYREFDQEVNLIFEIYDSRENCWRKSKTIMCKDISTWCHLLFNGIFHLSIVVDGDSFITIDAKSEMLGLLPLPSEINHNINEPLFILRGSLALFVNNYESTIRHVTDIWLMNEYGVKQSWTKQYTIEFGDVTLMKCKPIMSWKYMDNEEEDDELFLQTFDGKLKSINLVTNEITNFELYGIPSPMVIVPYIETLLPLKLEDL